MGFFDKMMGWDAPKENNYNEPMDDQGEPLVMNDRARQYEGLGPQPEGTGPNPEKDEDKLAA